MVGLVIAGPVADHGRRAGPGATSRRPAGLLAARRLADDPRAGFRAVSGLALALFVASPAVGVMSTMVAERGAPTGDVAATRRSWRTSPRPHAVRASRRSRSTRCPTPCSRTSRRSTASGLAPAAHQPDRGRGPVQRLPLTGGPGARAGSSPPCRTWAAAPPALRWPWSIPLARSRSGGPRTTPVADRPAHGRRARRRSRSRASA